MKIFFELLSRNFRSDICLECVEALKARNAFVKKVQLKERLVKQLLREKSKRYNRFDTFFNLLIPCFITQPYKSNHWVYTM